MKIPIGTRETEEEVHHYVQKKRVSEPVYLEIPFFPIAVTLLVLLLVFVDKGSQQRTTPTTVNIHIEKGE